MYACFFHSFFFQINSIVESFAFSVPDEWQVHLIEGDLNAALAVYSEAIA